MFIEGERFARGWEQVKKNGTKLAYRALLITGILTVGLGLADTPRVKLPHKQVKSEGISDMFRPGLAVLAATPSGEEIADFIQTSNIKIDFYKGDVDEDCRVGCYDFPNRTIRFNSIISAVSVNSQAGLLAHEGQHAKDFDRGVVDFTREGCFVLEEQALERNALVWRDLYGMAGKTSEDYRRERELLKTNPDWYIVSKIENIDSFLNDWARLLPDRALFKKKVREVSAENCATWEQNSDIN